MALRRSGPTEGVVAAWQASVASVLERDNVQLSVESAESMRSEGGVTTLGALEGLVRESFVEDDFEGRLHAIALRAGNDGGRCVAVLYWRDVEPDEMAEWLASYAGLLPLTPPPHSPLAIEHVASPWGSDSTDSADSPTPADVVPMELVAGTHVDFLPDPDCPPDWGSAPTSGWVKIEIMGTHPGYRRRGYGKVLLASALFLAAARDGMRHAVLQVAGGSSNKAAVALYEQFGFEPAPPGVFNYPNDAVMILRDVPGALARLFGDGGGSPSLPAGTGALPALE